MSINLNGNIGKPRAVRRDFMRCAQPDVRRGQDTRPTITPEMELFDSLSFPHGGKP